MQKTKTLITTFTTIQIAGLVFPTYSNAATCYSLTGTPPTVGKYLDCMLPGVWSFFQIIFIAVGVIIFMYSIVQYVMNRSNSKFLETFNQKMLFLLGGILLIAGFGTSLVDIFLKVMGLGNLQSYLTLFNEIINKWNY